MTLHHLLPAPDVQVHVAAVALVDVHHHAVMAVQDPLSHPLVQAVRIPAVEAAVGVALLDVLDAAQVVVRAAAQAVVALDAVLLVKENVKASVPVNVRQVAIGAIVAADAPEDVQVHALEPVFNIVQAVAIIHVMTLVLVHAGPIAE